MNDLSKLLKKLDADAGQQRQELHAKAAEKAEQITASYRTQADTIEQEILAEGVAKIEGLMRCTKSQRDIALRSSNLAARQELLRRSFEGAVEAICAYDVEKLLDFFTALACTGQTEDAEILLNQADATRFGPRLVKRINATQKKKNLTVALAQEYHQRRGGFILRQGDIDLNCTVEVLVQNEISALEAEVAAILFQPS